MTAIADDKIKVYGEDNPDLTISYSGFFNDENVTVIDDLPVASTNAIKNNDAGKYVIDVIGGTDNNYVITVIPGHLIIERADQILLFEPIPEQVEEGVEDLSLKADATSGLGVYFTTSDETIASITNSILSIRKHGEVEISANQDGNHNYNAAESITQNLTITEVVGLISRDVERVKVFPSPTSDYFHINLSDSKFRKVMIIDQNGIIVKKYLQEQEQYKVSDLSNGTYYILVQLKEEDYKIGKLVVLN